MARSKFGTISLPAAGNASLGIVGGGLGMLAGALVFSTAAPTRTSVFIRSALNVGFGLLGAMLIPGTFGLGFGVGLGGFGTLGVVAAAMAPDQLPAFRGLSKALSSTSRGVSGTSSRGYGKSLAGTMLGSR